MDQVHCILGKFFVVPTFVYNDTRNPSGKRWNYLSNILYGNSAELNAFSPFMYMLLATNPRQVTDGDSEVISQEYVFKVRLATTHDKTLLKFDLQITCSTFDFVT